MQHRCELSNELTILPISRVLIIEPASNGVRQRARQQQPWWIQMNGCGGGWQIRIWNQTEEFCDMERALASVRARAGLDTGIPIIYYLVTRPRIGMKEKGFKMQTEPTWTPPLPLLWFSVCDTSPINRRHNGIIRIIWRKFASIFRQDSCH